jgi:hypothetical protein
MVTKKSTIKNMFSRNKNSDNNGGSNVNSNVAELELRPGGMIVQKRNSDVSKNSSSIIKIKVKHGSSYHQIHISSHASFGTFIFYFFALNILILIFIHYITL